MTLLRAPRFEEDARKEEQPQGERGVLEQLLCLRWREHHEKARRDDRQQKQTAEYMGQRVHYVRADAPSHYAAPQTLHPGLRLTASASTAQFSKSIKNRLCRHTKSDRMPAMI